MTPAETEHFAALRMHVARLHAALVVACNVLGESGALVASDLAELRGPLTLSEPDVRELLKEADRDNALVQARADLEAALDATATIARRCTALEGACRHLVAVYRGEDAGSDEWGIAMTAAVEQLAEVLPK